MINVIFIMILRMMIFILSFVMNFFIIWWTRWL